jgi:hypothetical protein
MTVSVSRTISGWVAIGAICVASWVGAALLHRLDRVLEPWMYAKPSLTGNWQGDAMAGNKRLRLWLSLSLNPNRTNQDRTDLRGRVVLCDSTGRVQSYPLVGIVKDRQGSRAEVRVPGPSHDDIPGLTLDAIISLNWDGSTSLRAQTGLIRVLPGGVITTSSADPETGHPIPFLLHPGGASEQTCPLARRAS